MLTDGHAVSVRRSLNGVLFLDTALQTAVEKSDDIVNLEITLQEAIHLRNCLSSPVGEPQDVDNLQLVLKQLETGIEQSQQLTQKDLKAAKVFVSCNCWSFAWQIIC